MKDKLVIVDNIPGYQIQWYLAEEDDFGDDFGAILGEGLVNKSIIDKYRKDIKRISTKNEDFEFFVATIVAWEDPNREISNIGFTWRTMREVKEALKEIKARIKIAKSSVPYPEWALTAISQGWKPPKGWTP